MSQEIYNSPKSDLSDVNEELAPQSMKQLLFSFQGRIPRSTYWLSLLAMYGVIFAVGIISAVLQLGEQFVGIVVLLVCIPFMWVVLALQVKRWHDRNKSGWWVLIGFVPLIGPLWALIENGFLAGTDGVNNYGAPYK